MFERVCIVGVGLLGGSLARDLRHHGLAKTIVGVTRSQASASAALELQVVDAIQPLAEAVAQADLVVMATPMQSMIPTLAELAPHLKDTAIITDVGSVKTDLYAQLVDKLPSLLSQFVLAHPIAGGESSGVAASKQGLFAGKHVIMTSCPEESAEAVQRVESMWQGVGASTVTMSLQQHDSIFAKTSHLPHVVAFSLVNYLNSQPNRQQLFDLAASGFYDFTRIASSDAEMWRDICVTNRQEVVTALEGYILQLQAIKSNISDLDQEAIFEYFETAKFTRDSGLQAKQSQNRLPKKANT